jgi:hypothetical protein
MGGLGRLVRDYVETSLGKIFTYPMLYLFTDRAPKRARLCNRWDHQPFPERTDEDGRQFRLYKGKSVQCPYPDKWQGIYPRLDHKRRFHPTLADCKACEFHEPRRPGRAFACCRWYRENNNRPSVEQIAADAQEQALAVIHQQATQTK